MVLSNAEIEIEVGRAPICLWAIYLQRADGRKFLRVRLGHRQSEQPVDLIPLEPTETVALIKYEREDRRKPRGKR